MSSSAHRFFGVAASGEQVYYICTLSVLDPLGSRKIEQSFTDALMPARGFIHSSLGCDRSGWSRAFSLWRSRLESRPQVQESSNNATGASFIFLLIRLLASGLIIFPIDSPEGSPGPHIFLPALITRFRQKVWCKTL